MHTQEIASSESEPLWHIGRFACALSLQSDPPFLAVLKDEESILEVTVHSALEAKERADALRVIVQQCLVTDEPTGGPPAATSGYTMCPSCGRAAPIVTDDAATGELVMRCRGCGGVWRQSERRSSRRYRLGQPLANKRVEVMRDTARDSSVDDPIDDIGTETELLIEFAHKQQAGIRREGAAGKIIRE